MVTQQQLADLQNKFKPLESALAVPIPSEDSDALVKRWNDYYDVMDQIDAKIKDQKLKGVILNRHIENNLPRERGWVGGLAFVGVMVMIMGSLLSLSIPNSQGPPLWVGFAIGAPMFASAIIISVIRKEPETIKMSCAPVLHVNEFEFAQNIIKGLPQIERDPELHLPKFSIEISRQELSRLSMDRVNGVIETIKLPDKL